MSLENPKYYLALDSQHIAYIGGMKMFHKTMIPPLTSIIQSYKNKLIQI